MVHLVFGRLGLQCLGKLLVDFCCFLGPQIFNRAGVKPMYERISLLTEHAPTHQASLCVPPIDQQLCLSH
jgi:hypothetical protein